MIIKDSYDVVVVGAGPAGATAANYAAKKGVSVLLIDRKKDIGVPLQCGGFLPSFSVLEELVPNAELPYTLKEFPANCINATTSYQRFIAPDGYSKGFEVTGYALDRKRFDKYLVHEAASSDAHVLIGTSVTSVDGKVLKCEGVFGNFSVNAKVIVGADGPSSFIGRNAGLVLEHDPMDIATALEYELMGVNIDEPSVEMYFGKDYVPGGYAWIIPQGNNSANIGIGIRRPMCKKGMSYRDYLNHFMEKHPIASKKLKGSTIVSVIGGLVPVGGAPSRTVSGNVILAGDAAGHLIATNGGGISTAMLGGKIAGETAAEFVQDKIPLNEYEIRWRQQMGIEIKTAVYTRKLMDNLMKSDTMVSAAFKMISSEHMKAIQCGKLPNTVRSNLLKLNKGM